ncbi:hypothetical protein [Sphingomonas sp. 1185]|uniref:DUF5983 family protein n=1 Tax=Sphingomonas sp. 1185 TaxID=3156411 RepID=UPI0033931596
MTITDRFHMIAANRGWAASEQIAQLLDFIVQRNDAAGFTAFLDGRTSTPAEDGDLEQGRYCVLSTTHISHETSEWLESLSVGPPPPAPISVASTFYGWFVATREPDVPTEQIPDDLLAAMRFGRARGFDQILFDCDASVVDGLDVHDW